MCTICPSGSYNLLPAVHVSYTARAYIGFQRETGIVDGFSFLFFFFRVLKIYTRIMPASAVYNRMNRFVDEGEDNVVLDKWLQHVLLTHNNINVCFSLYIYIYTGSVLCRSRDRNNVVDGRTRRGESKNLAIKHARREMYRHGKTIGILPPRSVLY